MEKIASFTVDHQALLPGLYLSRRDSHARTDVTTFDLRFTAPNREPVMDVPAVHSIEHLGASYLRNCDRKDEVIYFGPMGCRTGFYLVMFGQLDPEDVEQLVLDMCDFILGYDGVVAGAQPEQCGNYLDHNLSMAKFYIRRYREQLQYRRFRYPQ
ncbi:MAG: S-ribosylhomocysteine lyase [Actinomycetaceae bacterium]|nr:S-ribosylhomocysteine lyase [Arcanobacterium sp.]MDD7686404.1 S-ribosylhomocysteine lyase [Actinomycetaceae bacterium]MDY5272684.1 S-ribosylhomocysteine lyase [Arcanobacterium sp.]